MLIPVVENIDLQYLKFTLEPIFRQMAKGRKGDKGKDEFTKLYPSMIEDVKIPIPVDANGHFDLAAQQEIAQKHIAVEQYKKDIVDKLTSLIEQKIEY